ncbi:hypothetical protein ES705_50644 [subsurface metagenome]
MVHGTNIIKDVTITRIRSFSKTFFFITYQIIKAGNIANARGLHNIDKPSIIPGKIFEIRLSFFILKISKIVRLNRNMKNVVGVSFAL